MGFNSQEKTGPQADLVLYIALVLSERTDAINDLNIFVFYPLWKIYKDILASELS